MQLGSIIHMMQLQPMLLDGTYHVMPEGMMRRGKSWDAFKADAIGREIVPFSIWQKASEINLKMNQSDVCRELLRESTETERRLEWTEDHGEKEVKMVGIFDYIDFERDLIVDIKTTSNADNISKLAMDGRWDLQAVQYIRGYAERYSAENWARMVFLVVEVNSPFRIREVELSHSAIKNGIFSRNNLVREFMDRLESDNWVGDSEATYDLPHWFTKDLNNG